jgi:hypothetical protein
MAGGNINLSYRQPELGLGTLVGYKKYTLTTTGIKLVGDIGTTGAGIIDYNELGNSTMAMVQVEATGLTEETFAIRYRQDATLVDSTNGFVLGNLDYIFLSNTIEMQNVSLISIDAGATITLNIQFFKQ